MLTTAAGPDPARASDQAYDAREHYTKYEYLIPMRDGVKLFASVLVPKDASKTYPFMIVRTPFGIVPYGTDEYYPVPAHTEAFLKAGYIWVRQDVRGRRMAEDQFTHMTPHRPEKQSRTDVDESTDTFDTIEWLMRYVPNHNGRVGIWGISYAGFYTAAGIIDTHPAIKGASPQALVADLFLNDDWYHGGAFMLAHTFDSVPAYLPQSEPRPPPKVTVPFDYGTNDCYEFFLKLGTLGNATQRLGEPPIQEVARQ